MAKHNYLNSSTNRRTTLNLIVASALSPIVHNLFAQTSQREIVDYPSRPIRIILGASIGGSTDVVTRLVTQKITELWSQPFLVENLTGGTGVIASETVARSVPNGYTLYAVSSSNIVNSAVDLKIVRSFNFRTSFFIIHFH
jgi:tripartite-type tricarboxylate transporter receptor subunit TctC